MSGYYGYSMSNNAVAAYECGIMPMSKWTKSAILAECGAKAEMLSKLTVAELRRELLYFSEWHHTSCHYNATDFYAIDYDKLEEFTEERVAEIIASRAPREKKQKVIEEPKQAEITFTVWVGQYRNYRRPQRIVETVTMKPSDKMVATSYGKKRVSCLDNVRWLDE